MENENYIYRYRSLANNYAFDELENDYFYCSELSKLNDPVENKFNLIFEGDEIDFRGLLKYYIFCFLEIVNGNMQFITFQDITRYQELKSDVEEMLNITLKKVDNIGIVNALEQVSKAQPLSLNYMILLFMIIHFISCFTVLDIFARKMGFINNNQHEIQLKEEITVNQIAALIHELQHWKDIPIIQLETRIYHIISSNHDYSDSPKNLNDFPEFFCNNLYKLCLGEIFVCCFSEDCENQLMWSHYANSDTGICFKYKAQQENENQYVLNNQYRITKIQYTEKLEEIDFFSNIRMMPGQNFRQFFYDEKQDKDRETAGNNMIKTGYPCQKLTQWAYEKELRFIQHQQSLVDQKMTYDFSQLEGIILGEKISLENKYKIISIIKEKCKNQNRNEFEIYQRKWSFDENKMITVKFPI